MKTIGVNLVASELDRATAVFVGERPRMLRIACRTLGNVGDAEDIVQEAWLRWQRTDRAVVTNPAAFLTTTASRLALNTATSARRRHESCTDPQGWDPADPGASPGDSAERAEAVGRALLLLLQTLSPMERAAYVLREAFGYRYERIGALLRVSSAGRERASWITTGRITGFTSASCPAWRTSVTTRLPSACTARG